MLQWRNDNDAALAALAGDPEAFRRDCEALQAAGLLTREWAVWLRGEGAVSGLGAWLWAGPQGLLCLAVAPENEAGRWQPAAALFARGAGPDWITKARAGLTAWDWSQRGRGRPDKGAGAGWDGIEWGCALVRVEGRPKARLARLVRVASVDAGRLVSVYPAEGAGAVAVEAFDSVSRWIPQNEHCEGYARLWAKGDTESGSYMWHVVKARLAEGRSPRHGAGRKARKKA